MNIEPKYHPNIIGRKGATINKIRDDHGVRIQLPDKEGSNSDEIVVTGYEHQVSSAREDILNIVKELVGLVKNFLINESTSMLCKMPRADVASLTKY